MTMNLDPDLLFAGAMFSLLFPVFYYTQIHKYVMTRAPAKTVLKLIKSREIDFAPAKSEEAWHFTLKDTFTEKISRVYHNGFSNTSRITGDLFWMNGYEAERVYKLVRKLIKKEEKLLKSLEIAEYKLKQEISRGEAVKVYENR